MQLANYLTNGTHYIHLQKYNSVLALRGTNTFWLKQPLLTFILTIWPERKKDAVSHIKVQKNSLDTGQLKAAGHTLQLTDKTIPDVREHHCVDNCYLLHELCLIFPQRA